MTLTIEIPKGSPVLIWRNLTPFEADHWFNMTRFLAWAHQQNGYAVPRGMVKKEN